MSNIFSYKRRIIISQKKEIIILSNMFFLERRIIISQSRENNRSPNMDN
jgi:hypothetical protein